MTDLKNNLEEVWEKEFESWDKERQKSRLVFMNSNPEKEAYLEARKKAQEDIEFWKNEYVSHSETMCRCQEELQKTREQLEVAEAVLSVQCTDSALAYFKDKQGVKMKNNLEEVL